MLRSLLLVTAALLAIPGAHAAESLPSPAPRHVVMISIDGLMPSAYTRPDELGLEVPHLRRLAASGAFARGVVGVLPTVTYPSHTTLVTGLPPREHGILWNTYFDPLGISNDAWLWYAREVKTSTLVTAVRAKGGRVGSVSWPVTVGSEADFLVPEFWRSGSTHPTDVHLARALSTPGLFERTETRRGRPLSWPATDVDRTDLALTVLREHRPELLLVHLFELDKQAHAYGPGSVEARAALEASDVALGRLLAALTEL